MMSFCRWSLVAGRWWGLVLALILIAGCDTLDPAAEYEEEFVVESYQVALEPLQPVLLSRTAEIDQSWTFDERAVSGADVQVNLLREDGSVESTFMFTEDDTARGVYRPDDLSHRLLPLRTYQIDVTTPTEGARILGTTIVPDTFSLLGSNADTVVYQGTNQLEILVTRSFYPGRQNVFVFVSEALEPSVEDLTPFAAAIWDQLDEEDQDLDEFAVGASPILNEANYTVNPDGTLLVELPWLAVIFYGPNRLTANAVDDNLFDFLRSQFVQENGSTLSPGEIPDVITNLDGARGVFGSSARSVVEAFVAR